MIRSRDMAAIAVLSLACSLPAAAQQPKTTNTVGTTTSGTWAIGADAGFSNPIGDDHFDAELLVDIYGEYFFTPHISVRGVLGVVSFDGPTFPSPSRGRADVDILMLLGDVIYQWQGGKVSPFVMGGVGLYDYDARLGDGDLEVGVNVGGGANFSITRRFAIKLEGAFHRTTGSEPDSFFNATVGARWMF